MSDMRNYLSWIQQNQQNNPQWKAAMRQQNRNQTPVTPPPQHKRDDQLPEGTEIIEETPED